MRRTELRRTLRWLGIALSATAALGCGESVTPPPPRTLVVTPPAIAWLPDGTPPIVPPNVPWLAAGTPITRVCPTGWATLGDRCEPWAASEAACSGAMIRVPGDAACRPLSPRCPSGDFAEGLPAGVLYVRAGAAPGGDGGVALPFATLAEALAVAGPGATVALSRGSHAISGTVDLDVSLLGACATETVLTAVGSARLSISTALRLADLTVRPGDADDPIFVDGPHAVSIERVWLDGGLGDGISAARSAALTLTDVRVANLGARRGAVTHSGGIVARQGGTIDGTRVVVDETTWIGASAGAASRITLVDSVLRATRESGEYVLSAGATCWTGGTLALTRTLLESNVSRGIEVLTDCAGTALDDVVIRGTSAGTGGEGYGLISQGAVTAGGLWFFDNSYFAVAALDGARLELDDAVVDGVTSRGVGFGATGGGAIVLRRSVVRNVRDALFSFEGGDIDAEDLHLERVSGNAARVEASTIAIRRAHVHDIATGFLAGTPTGSITAADVVFERVGRATQPDSDALTARGGSHIDGTRVIVDDASGAAVSAIGAGSSATISDFRCSGGGSCVFASTGGTTDITNAEIDAPGSYAAAGNGAATRIALTDAHVHDLVPADADPGYALSASDGAELVLNGVVVERVGTALGAGASGIEQPTPHISCTDVVFRELADNGVDLQAAAATFTRLRIERAGRAGIVARTAAVDLALTDVAIDETNGRSDGERGRGIDALGGAVIHGARVTIANTREVGLSASDLMTRVTLDDVWIDRTRDEACAAACRRPTAGHGVASQFEAIVTLSNFRISSSHDAAVLVANDGNLVLTDGLIDGNRIGRALLGMPPLGFSSSNVVYDRNERIEANADIVIPPSSAF